MSSVAQRVSRIPLHSFRLRSLLVVTSQVQTEAFTAPPLPLMNVIILMNRLVLGRRMMDSSPTCDLLMPHRVGPHF